MGRSSSVERWAGRPMKTLFPMFPAFAVASVAIRNSRCLLASDSPETCLFTLFSPLIGQRRPETCLRSLQIAGRSHVSRCLECDRVLDCQFLGPRGPKTAICLVVLAIIVDGLDLLAAFGVTLRWCSFIVFIALKPVSFSVYRRLSCAYFCIITCCARMRAQLWIYMLRCLYKPVSLYVLVQCSFFARRALLELELRHFACGCSVSDFHSHVELRAPVPWKRGRAFWLDMQLGGRDRDFGPCEFGLLLKFQLRVFVTA